MAIPSWKQPKVEPLVDFSFMDLETPEDAIAESPRLRTVKGGKKAEPPRRQYTRALRLNNNLMSELLGLSKLINLYFTSPMRIQWLDLSCNHFFKVPQELKFLRELRILYLHGNKLSMFIELQPLANLSTLFKLTLHGNPLDCEKNYRHTVLAYLPDLRSLDFSDVTPCDVFLANKVRELRERKRPRRIG